ncbi:hypothetical protein JAAARDRAFT_193473 [Jaapia argillacea MUCL 33604]|uniref:Zn(2)-C6 fungal-type domain-containing protein n=1 Tax=Jaapia argillacea MUCL 33604 TaxID=933084 RepID=A0A067PT49_9AGAM|nr:hypothetical protein JAAARDRAFT_193473 [Jaapia argillacea MUCL 33604]
MIPAVGSMAAPIHTKRGSVACKRCRRAKTKCLHTGKPPCRSCSEAGLAAACVFPPKGTSFIDRAPSKRVKRESDSSPASPPHGEGSRSRPVSSHQISSPSDTPLSPSERGSPHQQTNGLITHSPIQGAEELLPSITLIEEACDIFFVRVNQCAFLHKPTFISKLRDPARVVSPLLILSICALTYRFSPGLAQFCGSNKRPPSYFGDRARVLLFEALNEPTLESCQAGYFLGLADWGACQGKRSWMLMGIALRMAFLLGLHKEETHAVPPNAPPDQIIAAEESRRTFWTLLINDRCVSSGGCRPSSIVPSDISSRLPCDEDSFAFGTPTPAFYLDGFHNPPLTPNGTYMDMGMMAYMVQVSELWGRAARRACSTDLLKKDTTAPWELNSGYFSIKNDLARWTSQLPGRQQYSRGNLAVYYQRCLETAFTFNHVVHKAAEVILRRPYLPFIIRAAAPESSGLSLNTLETPWRTEVAPSPQFWLQCGKEMFYAAAELVTIINDFTSLTHYAGLSPHLGFSTFLAAATLTYVWRWPWLFPERAMEVPALVLRSTEILSSMGPTWPMARHWVRILKQPIKKRIDEAVQEDMATDQREGIYRQKAPTAEGGESSSEDFPEPMVRMRQSSPMMSPGNAPALHTLALAAAESMTGPTSSHPHQLSHPHQQLQGQVQLHPPLPPIAPGPHPGPLQNQQDLSLYSLIGPHAEMPFGDPSNPQSFNDVLAFMEGAEQWSYASA